MDGTVWGRGALLYVMDHYLGTDMLDEPPEVLRKVETVLDVALLAANNIEGEGDMLLEPALNGETLEDVPIMYPFKSTEMIQ
jgi:hypothetical protein